MGPNRLKQLRKARGITLDTLAAKVGTTNQQISHLELGKRQLTVEWLRRLAAALDCHPWEIVAGPETSGSREAELLKCFRSLSETDQDRLLVAISELASSRQAP